MKFQKLFYTSIMLSLLTIAACSDDETDMPDPGMMMDCMDENVSYANDILPIINNACALSGCHVAGFSSGDYSTYAGLKEKADNGSLNSRVVVNMSMPPGNSPGPTGLSDAQIMAFKCWIESGAEDN